MKKTIITAFLFMNGVLFFTACKKAVVGTGPVVTEVRNVTGFTGVAVSLGGRVNYNIGPVYKVEVLAQQEVLNVLETYKDNNELVVKTKPGVWVNPSRSITVNITAPDLNYINLDGSADIYVTGNAVAPVCTFRISGSGNINADRLTVADKFTATLSGSGDVKVLNGVVNNQQLKTSGSGKIDMGNVVVQKVTTEINGSGSMWVNAVQELDVKISGSGSVNYRGNPVISARISGSGRVRPF
jgi:Putative auto-transporter adhesin, head GIN domain